MTSLFLSVALDLLYFVAPQNSGFPIYSLVAHILFVVNILFLSFIVGFYLTLTGLSIFPHIISLEDNPLLDKAYEVATAILPKLLGVTNLLNIEELKSALLGRLLITVGTATLFYSWTDVDTTNLTTMAIGVVFVCAALLITRRNPPLF